MAIPPFGSAPSQWKNTTGGIYYLNEVGIGTSAPSAPLTVQGKTDYAVKSANLLVNRAPNNTTYWTAGTGWTTAATSATATAATGTFAAKAANMTVNIGTAYYVTVKINVTSGGLTVSIGGQSAPEVFASISSFVFVVVATTTDPLTFTPDATTGFTGSLTSTTTAIVVESLTPSAPSIVTFDSTGVDNLELRGMLNTKQTVAIGTQAMQYSTSQNGNVAIGYQALRVNQGVENVAIGGNCLPLSTGNFNVGVGYDALNQNVTGSSNVAIGFGAMQANVTGTNNVALGLNSLSTNYNGGNNISIGNSTLNSLSDYVSNSFNVGIGSQAFYVLTAGQYNVAFGYRSAFGLSTGSSNFIAGYSAAQSLTSGSSNTIIGANIDIPASAGGVISNYLSIGNVLIGNTSTQTGYVNKAVISKSSAYAALTTDEVILASGTTTITLPDATSGITGKTYTIKKTDTVGTSVTIATTSSQTIDGSTTQTLATQYSAYTVVSDGSNWQIIGKV